ncbi:MAG TPA: SH3 domain-containing protein [Verrucomicrobiae bacterium]|jgi:uncharacterized protein YgiM (DUF1202 family)
MKTNCWLILGTMIAVSAIAQENTNVPPPEVLPPIPAPVTSPTAEAAPVPEKMMTADGKVGATQTFSSESTPVKHKKRAAAPKKLDEPTVTLVPGPAEVAVKNLNVRGQAGLKGEFLTHLAKGDSVVVLSQINLDKHKADEPAQWAKIAFPTNAHIWVRAQFIDATNKVVLPKKLNLRAGPSENYSVLGVVERGAPVSEIVTKNDWMQIDPPTNAYAFVAAMYLKQEASGTLATNLAPSAETELAPAPMPVPESQPAAAEPTNAPEPTAVDTNAPATAETNPPAPMIVDTNLPPPPPRKVTHEGTVRRVVSPVAPTDYELYDPATEQNIDYLFTTSKTLDLGRYNGLRVVVTGTEGLDARWKDTPVITIERIQVVE